MSINKHNIKEVTRYIKKEVERKLWARAAGQCQFNGCNHIFYKSPVTQERIRTVMGEQVSVWELTAPEDHISNDNIPNSAQLSMMRSIIRKLMVLIKDEHGSTTSLSVFPVMAVSCPCGCGKRLEVCPFHHKLNEFRKMAPVSWFKAHALIDWNRI